MRTKNFLKHLILGALLLTTGKLVGQATVTGNVATANTNFLGWDNTSPANDFPLRVRHDGNWPIEWYTNAVRRMMLNPTQSPVINGFTVPTAGFLGLSGNTNFFNGVGPFSRLHLADNSGAAIINAQQFAFRPWQRNGITFTGNADHGYIGQEHNGTDTTDMVILWSNDFGVGQFAPDHLSIRFASNFGGAATGATSMRGLEAMRFFPVDRDRVNVGVGDFIAGNINDPLVTEPTEILDVLNGRVRIRQLPNDPTTTEPYLVMVVDNTTDPERGVVKWVDPSDLPGGGGVDCDWEITPNMDVVTAYDPAATSGCPTDESRVGIGIDRPDAKLHVFNDWDNMLGTAGFFHNVYGSQVASGLNALCEGGGTVIGARGRATMGGRNIGVWGIADNGPTCVGTRGEAYGFAGNIGCEGTAYGGGTATGLFGMGQDAMNTNLGVSATAIGGNESRGINATGQSGASANYGIRAAAFGANAHAGWFDGNTWTTGTGWYNNGLFSISDGNLKTAVEPMENALELVMQLAPKRYLFNVEAYPHLQLTTAPQIGLIAQEAGEVIPELVRETVYPAQFDSLGNITSEAFSMMGIDYAKLGPVIVGAIKEQQELIISMQQRLDELQAALVSCCAANSNATDQQRGTIEMGLGINPATERLLSIAPNPFTDHTTVSYTLERVGRAQLLVNSSDGKHLQVLEEGQKSEGQYNYAWSTAHLAPGIYYVTLLLDGEPLVKRAVKVR